MSINLDSETGIKIKFWLETKRPVAIDLIVERARAELSDYRKRDPAELKAAVARSYDNWCESVLKNDPKIAVPNSELAIKEAIAQGRNLEQLARTPWLICETALELLREAGNAIPPQGYTDFENQAHLITSRMITNGHLKAVSNLTEQVIKNFKV